MFKSAAQTFPPVADRIDQDFLKRRVIMASVAKMPEKKIVIFTGCQSNTGGTERAVANLAEICVSLGFSNVDILSVLAGDSTHYALPERCNLYWLFSAGFNKRALKSTLLPFYLIAYLRRLNPDILIVCESLLYFYIPLAQSMLPHMRVVCWEHFNAGANLGVKRRDIGRWFASRMSDATVVLSYEDAHLWKSRFSICEDRLHVIYNCLRSGARDCPADSQVGTRVQARQKVSYERSHGRRLVLAAGRLVPQKGFDLLITAWASMPAQVRRVSTLIIAGCGPEYGALEELVEKLGVRESVDLIGEIDSLGLWFDRADLFVLSSRFEGFGFVLIEALAAGVPCVSFDCPAGPCEIIEDRVNGLLVPKGDTNLLASALSEVLSNDDLRAALASRASVGLGRFSIQSIKHEWQKLFEKLAS